MLKDTTRPLPSPQKPNHWDPKLCLPFYRVAIPASLQPAIDRFPKPKHHSLSRKLSLPLKAEICKTATRTRGRSLSRAILVKPPPGREHRRTSLKPMLNPINLLTQIITTLLCSSRNRTRQKKQSHPNHHFYLPSPRASSE